MSIVYKNKFMDMLKQFLNNRNQSIDIALLRHLYNLRWVVYAKQPFAGPAQVVEYLGRYSHKVAISNHRIKEVEEGKVLFTYKDYADQSKQKQMSIDAEEFLRRFCLHILPPHFMKIRHYGILASRVKPRLKKQQMQMGVLIRNIQRSNWKEISKTKLNFDVDKCPCCKTGTLVRIMSFSANAPPIFIGLNNPLNEGRNQ